jgi:hypothetical protein
MMKEPPCTCTRVDVDLYDADACMLCNPNSPYNSAVSTQLENAVDYINRAIEELDQAHACLNDAGTGWNYPVGKAMRQLEELLKKIREAQTEMLEAA